MIRNVVVKNTTSSQTIHRDLFTDISVLRKLFSKIKHRKIFKTIGFDAESKYGSYVGFYGLPPYYHYGKRQIFINSGSRLIFDF